MISIVFISMLFFNEGLALKRSFQLQVNAISQTEPRVRLDESGNIYYRNYWGHEITKLNPTGHYVWSINKRGPGPGEVFKPKEICPAKDGKTVYVSDSLNRIQAFSSADGSFLQKTFKDLYVTRLFDDNGRLIVFCTHPGNDFAILELLNEDGSHQAFSGSYPANDYPVNVRAPAFTRLPDGTFLYQDGAYPILWQATKNEQKAKPWTLEKPAFYRDAPSTPFNPEYRFDAQKRDAYFDSFTWMEEIAVWQNDYLLVTWRILEPYKRSIDIYRISDQKRVKGNIKIPWKFVGVFQDQLYFLERRDETTDDEAQEWIHIYELKLDL